ncbi:hypothetical protein M378DRAFT_817260 [Amanita muscaria Koide BX008]|uniref:Uncharacterized protein n=1 Tax=Amanita muscaria (strain Koide BX008) TaxID=946122 RepID=A0A0C2WJS2_AMAMK|nr:hypothetical protein M378DRAFT_817260 [Amanita muscaria Koide BX008]
MKHHSHVRVFNVFGRKIDAQVPSNRENPSKSHREKEGQHIKVILAPVNTWQNEQRGRTVSVTTLLGWVARA